MHELEKSGGWRKRRKENKAKEEPLSRENVVDKVHTWSDFFAGKDGNPAWSIEKLAGKTKEFKSRLQKGETLDDILPEAFAVVRRVSESENILGKRHYNEQILAGFDLHQGCAVDMKTGEGKTLASTLAIYLNALTGKGVHIITSADSLVRRDALEMARLYDALGLTSGILQANDGQNDRPAFMVEKHGGSFQLKTASRQEAYQADITYGTMSQFGFDYLRDSMALDKKEVVQRGHNFAVVDEVDKGLIDEASTPIIISGEMERSQAFGYQKVAEFVRELDKDDYELDESDKTIHLTEKGEEVLSQKLGVDLIQKDLPEIIIPGAANTGRLVQKALEAEFITIKDEDYLVLSDPKNSGQDQIVILSDDGQTLYGRSWSDGLLQAVQAKEGLPITAFNRVYETTTVQHYIKTYKKRAGMSGSIDDPTAEELLKIYEMPTTKISPHEKIIRDDQPDRLFWDMDSKWEAIVEDAITAHEAGMSVLLGNNSIPDTLKLQEEISEPKSGIKEARLINAYLTKEEEDQIVARAGEYQAVTVATNMVGRGTDIKLGGESAPDDEIEKVKSHGGLRVIGTTRRSLRRLDNQLMGRAGRQGDPGSSGFYVSLRDNFLWEYAYQSPSFAAFLEKHKGKKGEILDESLRQEVLFFIDKAQRWHAGKGMSQREQMSDLSKFTDTQRDIFFDDKKQIMDIKEESKFDPDTRIQAMLEDQVSLQLENLHIHGVESAEMSSEKATVFLNWMEDMQPTTELRGQIMPSFGLHLFLQEAMKRSKIDSLESLSVPQSRKIAQEFQKMKAELLQHEKERILKSIKQVFNRTNLTRKAERNNLSTLIYALVPDKTIVNLSKVSSWDEITYTISLAYDQKIDQELSGIAAQMDWAGVIKNGMPGNSEQKRSRSVPLSSQQVIQLAARNFLDQGRVKAEDWWMVEKRVLNADDKPLKEDIDEHLQAAWSLSEENWEPYFDENQQLMTREMFKRKALLLAGNVGWTNYLENIAVLEQTLGVKSMSEPDKATSMFNRGTNQAFEDMQNLISRGVIKQIFDPDRLHLPPEGRVTQAGSYAIGVELQRILSQSEKIPNAQLSSMIDLYMRAYLAETGFVRMDQILVDFPKDHNEFTKKLLKIIDRQIVVFMNEFVSHEGWGLDVTFSSHIMMAEVKTLKEDDQKELRKLIRQLIQVRALQKRFSAMFNSIKLQAQYAGKSAEDVILMDPYEGRYQSKNVLSENIKNMQVVVDKLIDEIFGYLE